MKMRLSGFLAFALLSISILSYGLTGAVSAQSDDGSVLPLSVSTELPAYTSGDIIKISGSIKDLATYTQSVTVMIVSPDGSIVTIAQVMPDSSGNYTTSVKAGGTMATNGDYEIRAQYGSQKITGTFVYTGGEAVVVTPPPVTCSSNQTLTNGVCVDNAPPPPPPVTCSSNQTLTNGVCVDNAPPPVTCSSNQTLTNGVCIDNPPPPPACGPGTVLVDGFCQAEKQPECPAGYTYTNNVCVEDGGGACLIATAAYGTELAPQVQFLREIRDNTVLSTTSGAAFMTGFNTLYYSFAPTIADMERENPMFQDAVRAFITPMISTLSIMSLADEGSEAEVLGLGISVIALNLGMYIAAPALIGFKVHKHIKSRK